MLKFSGNMRDYNLSLVVDTTVEITKTPEHVQVVDAVCFFKCRTTQCRAQGNRC